MRSVLAVAMLLALAGCSDGPKSSPEASPTGTSAPNPGDGGGDGTEVRPGSGSLDRPEWTVGQAWTWQIESSAMPETLPVTTVVLAAGAGSYQVGVTNIHEALLVSAFHLVGLGAVDPATLAWDAHGQDVALLRFPLRDGDAFTTDLWGAPGAEVTITATDVAGPNGTQPGFRSTARYAGTDSVFLEADYDPALGQFVRVASHFGGATPFAQATLTGTSLNATGKSFVMTDLVRASVTTGDPSGLAPHQFTVPADVTVLLLVCFESGQGAYNSVVHQGSNGFGCQGPASTTTQYHVVTGPGDAGPGELAAVPPPNGSLTVELFSVAIA